MGSARGDRTKQKRRAAQTGQMIGVRVQPEMLARLDAFIADQPETVTRPQAMRALAEAALEVIEEAKR